MHLAAAEGHTELAAILVEKGIAMDHARHDGRLPIHLAKERGKMDVLEFLYHEMLARDRWLCERICWE